MRTLIISLICCLFLYSCVQDEGQVNNGAVESGNTTGSTSGGSTTGSSTGGTSGGTSGSTEDPLYAYQWHLNNTGQDVGSYVDLSNGIDSTPVSGIDINAEEAHALGYTGNGVRVAVSDSGTDYTHTDLDGNFLSDEQRNYAFLDPNRWDDSNADAYPSGNEGHGTSVAGIIAAEGWNGEGGRGVAPDASFAAFKFIMDYASYDHMASYEDKTIHQTNGDFDIFNYSYGYSQLYFLPDYDSDVKDAFEAGVTSLRSGKGALYVQSAGNSYIESPLFDTDAFPLIYGNTNATASLSFPEKVIVAAVSADGVASSYSTPGSGIWVSGLGGVGMTDVDGDPSVTNLQYFPAIYTTDIRDCSSGYSYRSFIYRIKNPFNFGYDTDLNSTCDYTNLMNGTSSAAPMVTGVVALMLEANPDLTWRDVKYILAMTSTRVDWVDPTPALVYGPLSHPAGKVYAGGYVYDYKWIQNSTGVWFSNWYGFGLVNAEAAVQMAASWTPAPLGVLGVYDKTETAGVWDHTDATVVPIPEDMTTPATSTIAGVRSLTIEAVQVKLSTNHPNPEQLAVHLVSPSGTESRLVLVDSGIINLGSNDYYFQSNAFLDEDSGGVWTIKVYDPEDIPAEDYDGDTVDDFYTADTGSITGWAINIHGH